MKKQKTKSIKKEINDPLHFSEQEINQIKNKTGYIVNDFVAYYPDLNDYIFSDTAPVIAGSVYKELFKGVKK